MIESPSFSAPVPGKRQRQGQSSMSVSYNMLKHFSYFLDVIWLRIMGYSVGATPYSNVIRGLLSKYREPRIRKLPITDLVTLKAFVELAGNLLFYAI